MNYDYLSEQDFDLMCDDEYQLWMSQHQQWLEEQAAYEEMLGDAK
jgi:hypothetical protein